MLKNMRDEKQNNQGKNDRGTEREQKIMNLLTLNGWKLTW